MPETRASIIAQVQMKLPVPRNETVKPGRTDELENILVDVLESLCDVADGNVVLAGQTANMGARIRRALTTDFNGTLDANGKLALPGSALDKAWIKTIHTGKLFITGYTREAAFVHDFGIFLTGTPNPDVPRWIVSGSTLYARTGDPSRPVANATFTLKDAIFEPVVGSITSATTTLPDSLVDDVVRMVVAEQLQRIGRAPQAADTNNG